MKIRWDSGFETDRRGHNEEDSLEERESEFTNWLTMQRVKLKLWV